MRAVLCGFLIAGGLAGGCTTPAPGSRPARTVAARVEPQTRAQPPHRPAHKTKKSTPRKAVSPGARKAPRPPEAGTASAKAKPPVTGIKECDEYIRYYHCYLKLLLVAENSPEMAAFRKIIRKWKGSFPRTETEKTAIVKNCSKLVRNMRKALSRDSDSKKCLRPANSR